MLPAFLTGFFLGLSLIVAIGAQNAFLLRQGILKQHVIYIVMFCGISDCLLIILGVAGISYYLNDFINEFSKIIYGFSALWLFVYGLLRLHSAYKTKSFVNTNNPESKSLLNTISITAIFTFLNPHVYLDTMILIGSISMKFSEIDRIYFTIGACFASFIWFFTLGFGAKYLAPIIQKPSHWRILDLIIALIMFIIAINLAIDGNWL